MKKITLLAILSLCLILSCCEKGCDLPTDPDDPDKPDPGKPTAKVDFSVVESPFHVRQKGTQWYIDIHILIKETGGVAVTISDVKTEWVKSNDPKVVTHSAGGRLAANGSLTVGIYSTCPGDIKADFIRITVIGQDDNGHDINVSHKWDIDWSGTLAVQVQ